MSRKKCFTCTAADGKQVTLYKDRYDDHILAEHPELLRDYGYPAQEIEYAICHAERTQYGKGKARIYVGPPMQANPPAGAQRISVVVLPESSDGDRWWVVTAYAEAILT